LAARKKRVPTVGTSLVVRNVRLSRPRLMGLGNPLVAHGKLFVFPKTELVCNV